MSVDLSAYTSKINTAFSKYLPHKAGYFKTIYDAMHYSIEAGGTRTRPT